MANTGCLEGMACPECGYTDEFKIAVTVRGNVWVVDDGFAYDDIREAQSEWFDDDYCQCAECCHEGTVADFKLKEATT